MQRLATNRRRRSRRSAFTLVEILVVVSIIAILVTLTIRVVGSFMNQARAAATETTIRKVQGLLNSRAEALHRQFDRTSLVTSSGEYFALRTDPNFGLASQPLQKVCTKKLLVRKFFPQSPRELNSNLQPKLAAASNVTNPDILYDFLTQSNVLGDTLVGTDSFSTSEVKDADGSGNLEFVDGWGRSLRFYRWPTRLFRPLGKGNPINLSDAQLLFSTLPTYSGNIQNDLSRDPDDPLQLANRPLPNGINFETTGITGDSGPCFHTPATYHVMLVVSAGPDGELGLYEPTDYDNNGHLGAVRDANFLADDITYLNVRAGGK